MCWKMHHSPEYCSWFLLRQFKGRLRQTPDEVNSETKLQGEEWWKREHSELSVSKVIGHRWGHGVCMEAERHRATVLALSSALGASLHTYSLVSSSAKCNDWTTLFPTVIICWLSKGNVFWKSQNPIWLETSALLLHMWTWNMEPSLLFGQVDQWKICPGVAQVSLTGPSLLHWQISTTGWLLEWFTIIYIPN